ncbi:MAG: DUF86 domain-containing protein [Sulfuricella sp.]|nr:DUF86 domain-containing protein [Sulfuricella sp.]
MPERHHQLYLTDILDSGPAFQSYVQDIAFEQFIVERMRCAAVIREFEIIGEAVGKLPETVKADSPEVPWRDINAIKTELPLLLDATQTILSGEQTKESNRDAL